LGLIAWKRLFFRFAFGLDRRLKSEARSVLSRDVLDWNVPGALCSRRGRPF